MTDIASQLDQARDRLKDQAAASSQAPYLTVSEAAQLARCNEKTIRRAIQLGKLKAFRPVRRMLLKEEDVRGWVESKAAVEEGTERVARPRRGRARRAPGSVAALRELERELS